MLLEFSVQNYRSFGEEAVFSMVSTHLRAREPRLNVENCSKITPEQSVLSSAVLYGGNASGKSNLIRALGFMRALVVNSARESQSGESIGTEPFRLHPELRTKPTVFEVVFRHLDTQYRYGFEVGQTAVQAEWLYRMDQEETCLFDRVGQSEWTLPSGGITGMPEAETVAKLARDNALFLSVLSQFNQPLAISLVAWFQSLRFLGGIHDEALSWTARKVADDAPLGHRICQLVAQLDLGIDSISAKSTPMERTSLPDDMPSALVDILLKSERYEVGTTHAIIDDDGVTVGQDVFSLESEESDGTRKLFALSGPILETLESGGVILIDEFDARLHPTLSRALVELFHGTETNPKGAQLIVATHDTNLLDRSLLRRDQIWFVRKNHKSQSELYSLASIKVRNDASYERDYLTGRYGAVPLPRQLSAVVAEMLKSEPQP